MLFISIKYSRRDLIRKLFNSTGSPKIFCHFDIIYFEPHMLARGLEQEVEMEVEECQLKPSRIYLKHMQAGQAEVDNGKTETELVN